MRILLTLGFLCWADMLTSQMSSPLSDISTPGVERIHLNPALGVLSPYAWDVTLAGGQFHAHTDYYFLRRASLLTFVNRANNSFVVELQSAIPETADVPLIIFDEDRGQKELFFKGRVLGPSFTFSLDESTRVGLFSQYRAEVSSSDIPEGFGIYELNDSFFTEEIDVDNGNLSAAAWLEIGAHFSKQVENISFGANIKLLRASEGGFIESREDFTYSFVDSVFITDGRVDFDLSFTNQAINGDLSPLSSNGSGIGIDLGFNYQSDLWNLGVAIHDIGVIQFKTNVESYTPEVLADVEEIRTQDLRDFSAISEFLLNLQNELDIEPDFFSVFSVGLPTRLTLQGEFYYNNDITIAAQLNQRLPLFENSLKSLNSLVVTPSYKKGIVTAYAPVSIIEFSRLRLGAAVRVGPLTIGSDHIPSVFFNHDFRGSDIYARISITPFGSGRSSKGGKRRGKDVECPMF